MQFTVKAKIKDRSNDMILNQMGAQLSSSRRKLFVQHILQKRKITELKKEFILQEQITARQFNSIAYEVKALFSSYKEIKKDLIIKTRKKIKKLKSKIKSTDSRFKIHQFKRKLKNLELKLKQHEEHLLNPSICFGEKKLFQKQFHLKENGYTSHDAWKQDWNLARNGGFFLIGSKDESFGNQSCQLLPGRLKLRLTHLLSNQLGLSHIEIPIEFTYQEDRVFHALSKGQALHYRFVKEKNGFWYVHLTFELEQEKLVTNSNYGALGIDLNPNCIAVTQVDAYGNYVKAWQIPIHLRGRRSEQNEATLGDAIAKLVQYAKEQQIPIVIEDLDFENKKQQLRSRAINRMLSQFCYSLFSTMMRARCYRESVQLIVINPAYTSVIGKVKFSHGYGISVHMAAAMAIARRGLGFGERLRAKTKLSLRLPVRNRQKHSWSDWRKLNPRVFPEIFIIREDRQRPERKQSEKSSSLTAHVQTRSNHDTSTRTLIGSRSEVILH